MLRPKGRSPPCWCHLYSQYCSDCEQLANPVPVVPRQQHMLRPAGGWFLDRLEAPEVTPCSDSKSQQDSHTMLDRWMPDLAAHI